MLTADNSTKAVLLFLVGAALFEVSRELRESTPHIEALRQADSENERHALAQHLVDGEAATGIVVAGAALVSAWACDSWVPALILVGTYLALVYYRHDILGAPNTI